jgi:preprotein translocase subunit SecY
VAEGAAEAFFRSEIRRRLAITAALIVLSRVGYFIPLPGFDRRLIPDSYLSFAPLPAGPYRRIRWRIVHGVLFRECTGFYL